MSTNSLISKKTFMLAATAFVGIVAGFSGMALVYKKADSKLASINQPINWNPPGLGKHLMPVRTQVILPESLPENDSAEVEITGYVTVNQPIDGDLHFDWILPEGVQVIEGQTSDSWQNVLPGQTLATKLYVTGFSKAENRILTLEAYAMVDSKRLGNTATVSSRPEDSMEYIAPLKAESRRAFDEENKKATSN